MSGVDEIRIEVENLLASLNYWEQTYGITYIPEPRLKSTDEAHGRIAYLKQKLKTKGAIYYWKAKQYVLDAFVEPSQGEQGPDELKDS